MMNGFFLKNGSTYRQFVRTSYVLVYVIHVAVGITRNNMTHVRMCNACGEANSHEWSIVSMIPWWYLHSRHVMWFATYSISVWYTCTVVSRTYFARFISDKQLNALVARTYYIYGTTLHLKNFIETKARRWSCTIQKCVKWTCCAVRQSSRFNTNMDSLTHTYWDYVVCLGKFEFWSKLRSYISLFGPRRVGNWVIVFRKVTATNSEQKGTL